MRWIAFAKMSAITRIRRTRRSGQGRSLRVAPMENIPMKVFPTIMGMLTCARVPKAVNCSRSFHASCGSSERLEKLNVSPRSTFSSA